MKNRLRIGFTLLLFLELFIVAYFVPNIAGRFQLTTLEEIVLLLIGSLMCVCIGFFIIEFFVTLPFKDFIEYINREWRRNHDLKGKKISHTPVELELLYYEFSMMLETLRHKTRTLREDEQLNELKYGFIAIASHQLRTPLTGIKWVLGSALTMPSVQKHKDLKILLERAHNTLRAIMNITNQLLSAIQISASEFAEQRENLDIESMARELITENKLLAQSRDVDLILCKKKNIIPSIKGNREQVRLILQNLVANAIYYSPSNQKIEIVLDHEDAFVYAHVIDHGIGIPDEEKHLVFERFFRGSNATRVRTEGSGLGLNLAKNIALHHGGDITFKSKPDEETAFTVSFPIPREGELETFIAPK